MSGNICCNDLCKKNNANLQCPHCQKYDFDERFFCSQQCFASCYKLHDIVHQLNDPEKWKNFIYTGSVRHHYVTQKKSVSNKIPLPEYANVLGGVSVSEENTKNLTRIVSYEKKDDIEALRKSGKYARLVLNSAKKICKIGTTTDEIDRVVHEKCEELGIYPSPLNYYGFPKSCCTSVNEIVCHGIPDQRELESGDLCNIDVSIFTDDRKHGDCNETITIGTISEEEKKLIQTTKQALKDVIEFSKPGMFYRDIGKIIENRCKMSGLEKGIVRNFGGHGIGNLFHTSPQIPHFAGNKAVGVMRPGHVFCVEPMVNLGSYNLKIWPDKWTISTLDGSKSCQFEHMLMITDSGCEVLTLDENDVVMNC